MARWQACCPSPWNTPVGLERLSPLADTAIGGLLLGTVLTLFYRPMFYVWVAQRRKSPRPLDATARAATE